MADALNLRLGAPYLLGTATSTAFLSFTLDHANDVWAQIISVPAGITITSVGFRYTLRTGTPPTYKLSLQSVTSGAPSGTILGGGTPAEATFTPPADASWDGTWQWITLDNSYTTVGGIIAIVIQYDSGTIDGSNNSQFTNRLTAADASRYLGYVYTDNNGVVAKTLARQVYGYRDASTTYGFPVVSMTSTSYSVDSTPDEYALRFTIPTTFCATYTVRGLQAQLAAMASSKTLVIQLYDTDGSTVLQSVTWDSDDNRVQSDTSVQCVEIYFDESSLSTLTAGSVYRIGFAPQETSANARLLTLDVPANSDLSAFPLGSHWYLNTRSDSGAWTDDNTVDYKRPAMELILKDWTVSAGGGSFTFVG